MTLMVLTKAIRDAPCRLSYTVILLRTFGYSEAGSQKCQAGLDV